MTTSWQSRLFLLNKTTTVLSSLLQKYMWAKKDAKVRQKTNEDSEIFIYIICLFLRK
jgi:hypothetical protein